MEEEKLFDMYIGKKSKVKIEIYSQNKDGYYQIEEKRFIIVKPDQHLKISIE